MGKYWPSTLNSMLWTLVYFLPILSGTIADQIGFKKALLGAFVLLTGVSLDGHPRLVRRRPAARARPARPGDDHGRSWRRPRSGPSSSSASGVDCQAVHLRTVKKTSGRATLAFGIFYMAIYVGSLFGRGALLLRPNPQALPTSSRFP